MGQTYFNYEEALGNPGDVKELVFAFNNSNHPYTNAFPDARIKNLLNLETLRIHGFTESTAVLPEEIERLKKLTSLSLTGRNLSKVPELVWRLGNLTSFHLEGKGLSDEDLKLDMLKNVTYFSIRCWEMKHLPASVFGNTGLQSILIHSDDLEHIPEDIANLSKLDTLRIHCRQLSTLPSAIGKMVSLKNVDIYNQASTAFTVDLSELIHLKEFRWGAVRFFPAMLATAPNLSRINFDSSEIEDIQQESLNFKKLTRLYITHSKLRTVPKALSTITTLKSLSLDYNAFLETIEFDFKNLQELSSISFRTCENFNKIDLEQFITSLKTIPNLKRVETPNLSKEQMLIREKETFNFEWEQEYMRDYED